MKKSAFTLIELLVVISIIAILAGIALPVFQKASEKGRALQDLNNLKQLGVGVQAYLNDNGDDMFNQKNTTTGTWPLKLAPAGTGGGNYIGDWKVFLSPFDKRPFVNASAGTNANVSYGVNSLIFSGTDASTAVYTHPSQLILMAPAVDPGSNDVIFSGQSNTNVKVTPTNSKTPARGTHNNRRQINSLFADFHAATVPWNDFTDSQTAPDGLNRWNPTAP
ncbi:MAG: hypothetical protein QOD99_3232 [Chthoniobacter sp.]|jgi:prepilin-type N-terminal cleavage/methylation domain-containing protein/prepilin-type processing-associated H-X9-DG protein|nr:hypothetical protein [Chthoniobacter sp.]